jgi:plasmid stabilization system protein ParE
VIYKLRFLGLARDDKRAIRDYLKQFYPSTPAKFTAKLKKQLAMLKENPYMCPEYPDNPAYRRLIVGKYLVFYEINENEKMIYVYRILRASWDIEKYL